MEQEGPSQSDADSPCNNSSSDSFMDDWQEVDRPLSAAEKAPTYADEETKVLGCKHYRRDCKVRCPQCRKFVTCRFCHDETADHQMNRFAVKEVMCMRCGEIQSCQKYCQSAECEGKGPLAKYFCAECVLYDNSESKSIYHCPKCKLCRVGKGLGIDYFHCDGCGVCMAMSMKDNHKCINRCLESNCPVCMEWMFTSREPVLFAKCGHGMHHECFKQYTKHNYHCPVCMKSLGDMQNYWKRIDSLLAAETNRPTWFKRKRTRITCNDCQQRGDAPYHYIYHKCPHCGSYNTSVIDHYEARPPDDDDNAMLPRWDVPGGRWAAFLIPALVLVFAFLYRPYMAIEQS